MGKEATSGPDARYLIRRPAPRPQRISDYGLARSEDGADLEMLTMLEAELTVQEFHAIFGPEASITDAMIRPVTNSDNWDVVLTIRDVMTEDGGSDMMGYAIRALLTEAGEDAPARLRPLGRNEIGPAALNHLLEAWANTVTRHGVDPMDEARRLARAGLGLQDFCAVE